MNDDPGYTITIALGRKPSDEALQEFIDEVLFQFHEFAPEVVGEVPKSVNEWRRILLGER